MLLQLQVLPRAQPGSKAERLRSSHPGERPSYIHIPGCGFRPLCQINIPAWSLQFPYDLIEKLVLQRAGHLPTPCEQALGLDKGLF